MNIYLLLKWDCIQVYCFESYYRRVLLLGYFRSGKNTFGFLTREVILPLVVIGSATRGGVLESILRFVLSNILRQIVGWT